ncbi:MAG: MGMT family protein, partial [Proteobacteria bacterium]|nr:MGMT family protein [Pseudomonadota bacterium]
MKIQSPFIHAGTEFQKKVWTEIAKISYGQTRTYGELARAIGSPGSARAVGSACGANPVALIIPCHRVVGATGLGGFAG